MAKMFGCSKLSLEVGVSIFLFLRSEAKMLQSNLVERNNEVLEVEIVPCEPHSNGAGTPI